MAAGAIQPSQQSYPPPSNRRPVTDPVPPPEAVGRRGRQPALLRAALRVICRHVSRPGLRLGIQLWVVRIRFDLVFFDVIFISRTLNFPNGEGI